MGADSNARADRWRFSKVDVPPILTKHERGKRKTRSDVKRLLLLLLIQREGPIGRYRLKTLLGMAMHEGIVRHMLEEYQVQSYLTSTRQGASLTPRGQDHLQTLLRQYRIRDIQKIAIPLMSAYPITIGVHLDNCADRITSAMDLRDKAVRGGATGATIIIYRNDVLTIPTVDPLFIAKNPTFTNQLKATFALKPNDMIVLISADTDWKGLEAAVHVAVSLSDEL